MNPDYRQFLRVLGRKHSGRAVLFEYTLPRELNEQLIWRRGNHLWDTEQHRVHSIIDAARIAGLDCAAVEFAPDAKDPLFFPGLVGLFSSLPEGIRIAAGLPKGFAEVGRQNTAGKQLLEQYLVLARDPAVCAVMIRDSDSTTADIPWYSLFVEEIHRLHKPCIWVDCSTNPFPLENILPCGFDAVHLSRYHPLPTAHYIKEFGDCFAILGDTNFSFTSTAKPARILEYCTELFQKAGGQGYAFGTGNIHGNPIPYLNFVSVLSFAQQNR